MRPVQRAGGQGLMSVMAMCDETHGTSGLHTPKRTLLWWPQRAAERPATAVAGTAVRAAAPAVEPWPSTSTSATIERPIRAGEATG